MEEDGYSKIVSHPNLPCFSNLGSVGNKKSSSVLSRVFQSEHGPQVETTLAFSRGHTESSGLNTPTPLSQFTRHFERNASEPLDMCEMNEVNSQWESGDKEVTDQEIEPFLKRK
ncbi:unnamed protein product [Sphenostylis stenocarpa]|uniref:Uncharacterized protein n=1 Tax=Sphenostylis stenocarpa TaxID=92480 RepID=A0AA86SLR2_9FABA|nr:unnamed protein product [Sphenostylis stenocarpa]